MDKKKESISKNIIRYSASNYFRQLLSVLTAFVRPKLLSPEYFGLWNLFKIIQTYSAYMHLGSRSAMRYLIPFHDSRKEDDKIRDIKGSTYWGSFYLNLMLAVVLVLISFLNGLGREQRVGLITFAVIVMLQWYCDYRISLLKACQNFKLISSSNYVQSSLMFILTLVLIYFWGIVGAFASVIVSLSVMVFYFMKKAPGEAPGVFKGNVFRKLVRYGFPIMLFNVIAILIRTSDRIMVSWFLGMEELGYYSIAIMILGFLMNIPGVSREVIEPKIMARMGSGSSGPWIREFFVEPIINTAYLMPFLIGLVVFALPIFINRVLPVYVTGVFPAQILVVGGYFLALSHGVRGIIVAHNWQMQASVGMLFSLVCNIMASIAFIKAGLGIVGVSLGSALSFWVLLVCQLLFVCKKNKTIVSQLFPRLFHLFFPFLVMCLSIVLLERGDACFSVNDLIAAVVKLLLFFIISLGVVVANKGNHTLGKKKGL
ncbi:MAG: oligosaccharide flippase family protein [Desulfobacterium sp.]|nr:oligosaccharide flippase family protein [Desulfobacterium sp.]